MNTLPCPVCEQPADVGVLREPYGSEEVTTLDCSSCQRVFYPSAHAQQPAQEDPDHQWWADSA